MTRKQPALLIAALTLFSLNIEPAHALPSIDIGVSCGGSVIGDCENMEIPEGQNPTKR